MPFFNLDDVQAVPLVEGITVKAIYGDKVSASFLELAPFASIPPHHHDNEQIGIVLEGEVDYTIGSETMRCRRGAAFIVPSNTIHSGVVVSKEPARLISLLTPPRQVSEPLKTAE